MSELTRAERKLLKDAVKTAEARTSMKWLYVLPIGFALAAALKAAIAVMGWLRGGDILAVANGLFIATLIACLALSVFFLVRFRLTSLSLVG